MIKRFLFLRQGVIDLEKEVVKLGRRKEALSKQLGRMRNDCVVSSYESKVPDEIRLQNSEKVSYTIG